MLYVGQTWQPATNVAALVDIDGQLVASSQLKISGQLNLAQPGKYLMTYQFTDQHQQLHTATTLVMVLANQAHLTVKAPVVDLTVGDQWVALNNLQQAMDVDGSLVTPAALKVDDLANNQVPGTYIVTYQFTDQLGQVQRATTKVIVKPATVVNPDDNSGQNTDNQPDEPTPIPTPDPDVPSPAPNVPSTAPAIEQPTETQITAPNGTQQPQSTAVKSAKQHVTQQPVATMTFSNTAQIMLAPAKIKLVTSPTKLTSATSKTMPANQAHRQNLPQTNEQTSWIAAIGTMLLAMVTAMMAWVKGKQDRRKD